MKNRIKAFVGLLLCLPMLSGCYVFDQVGPNQSGIKLDGGKFIECTGSGMHADASLFTTLDKISNDTFDVAVADPQVATSDDQFVGVSVTVKIRRATDCESLQGLIRNYPTVAHDDTAFQSMAVPATLEAMKIGTRNFTLSALLSDRNGLAKSIETSLKQSVGKFYGEVVLVQVANVAPADDYAAKLQQQANLRADQAVEVQRASVIKQKAENEKLQRQQDTIIAEEQLKKEQAQTAVEVEIAKREGEKVAAANQVYQLNPQAYELKRLEMLGKVFGDKSVFYVPGGSSLNMIMMAAASGAVTQTLPLPIAVSPTVTTTTP